MKKEQILNKIKNLLDLASDQNSVHEAEAASKKAQALIMKYNVEEAELHKGVETKIQDVLYPLFKIEKKAEGKWLRDLFHAVAKFNFCRIIISQKYSKETGDFEEHFWILGEAQNVELVKYLSEQLVHRLRAIRKQAYKNYDGPDSRGNFKRAFLKGASIGIYQKLQAQQMQFSEDPSSNAVIVHQSEKLDKFVANRFGDLGKARNGSVSSNSGFNQGVKAGKSMNVNAGVKGKAGARLLN